MSGSAPRIRHSGNGGVRPMARLSDFRCRHAPWLSEGSSYTGRRKIGRITVAAPLANGGVFTRYYNMSTGQALLASISKQMPFWMRCVTTDGASGRRGKMTRRWDRCGGYHGVLGRVALCSDRRRDPPPSPRSRPCGTRCWPCCTTTLYKCYRFMELGTSPATACAT